MVRGEQRSLPRRAFVALAVTEHAENAKVAPVALSHERHSRRKWKTVAERACGDFYAWHVLVCCMARERRAVLIESFEVGDGEVARFSQRSIQRCTRMSLA